MNAKDFGIAAAILGTVYLVLKGFEGHEAPADEPLPVVPAPLPAVPIPPIETTGGYTVKTGALPDCPFYGGKYYEVAFDKSICLNLRTMRNENCSSWNTYCSKLAAGLLTGACLPGAPETCGHETYEEYLLRWPTDEQVGVWQCTYDMETALYNWCQRQPGARFDPYLGQWQINGSYEAMENCYRNRRAAMLAAGFKC